MLNILLISIGKTILTISRFFNLGSGSTWPGHIALKINKNFIRELKTQNIKLKTIFIAGTNGKTTTAKLIKTILENNGSTVLQNESGANLLNGIASTLIQYSNKAGKIDQDFAIFEIDENTLPLALKEITPDYLVLLNLFRDQLDRYGEVDTIARKWQKAIEQLNSETIFILNADDPQIAHLGISLTSLRVKTKQSHPLILYFGLNDKTLATKNHQHAVDSIYCLNCGSKLTYKTTYFSHLGDWECTHCGSARPRLADIIATASSLTGIYNQYNILAAVLLAKANNISSEIIEKSLKNFSPAFGRQEIIDIDSKKIQLFLSKNPTSFNQSLRTIAELKANNLLIVLNDRVPDGKDVSWIWDVDTEELKGIKNIIVSGDRTFDMALRLKYESSLEFSIKSQNSNHNFLIEKNLKKAIQSGLEQTPKSETLYVLPTYSAMLEIRKILTGKGIL